MRCLATIFFVIVISRTCFAQPGPADAPIWQLKLVESIEVPAQETGMLSEVQAAEGQMVRQGDALAQIDDREARLAVDRAKIERAVAQSNAHDDVSVRFAKKAVDVARAEMQRSTDSIKKYPKSISDSEMDRLRLVVEKNMLEVEQAEHEFALAGLTEQIKANDLQAAEEKLMQHRIVAATPGLVVQVHHHRGEWVHPGDSVLRILRLDRLRAEGFLKSQDAGPELLGRGVKLTIDGDPLRGNPGDAGRTIEGKVSFINPEVDPINSQVRVWVDVPNADLRLRPGMKARVEIEGVKHE